ncbi:MAG: MFS transporter [Elusimicrobiota bacterium]
MGPSYILGLLLACNLLKYVDRQVLYALLPLIKTDLDLSDARLGMLASAFMFIYMFAAPPAGFLADRGSRRRWIASGVALWSLATSLTGLARSFVQIFLARAAIGIGQSGFSSVSPAFVAEHFPKERRGGVLAMYSLGIPVGSALGYVLGGWIGHRYGWRCACLAAGLPGIALAVLAWRLRDPRERDGNPPRPGAASEERPSAGALRKPPRLLDFPSLYRIRSYVAATLAMAAMTFALGGLAVWAPSFLTRYWAMNVSEAGMLFGGMTVVSGLVGTLLGGWLGDRLLRVTGKAYFLVSGAGLLLALPASVLAILTGSFGLMLAALFAAETLAFLNMGPLNAVFVCVTSPMMRSMAFAANIFVIHALGDAVSPAIIGYASDLWGLRAALVGAMFMLGVAGLICMWGARHIEADSREVENAAA